MGVMLDCYEFNDLWIKEYSWDLKVQRFDLVISSSFYCKFYMDEITFNTAYWVTDTGTPQRMNNQQPSSHPEHDNPIPMCLMSLSLSRLFVVRVRWPASHWMCLLLLRPELQRWEALVIPGRPAPWELWEIGLWHWSTLGLVRAQCQALPLWSLLC